MPWIETEIKGRFTTKKGVQMVSFTARRDDGRSWAAPEWLVSKGLRNGIAPGLAVRIQVNGERIEAVQRNRHQPGGVPPAAAAASARHGRTTTAGPQTASRTVLPYGFVPIDPASTIIDTPIKHDGSSGGDLLSGEILCELEALTPLLPGNQRYSVKKDGKEDGPVTVREEIRDVLARLGGQDPKVGKQIAEPLRLPDDRVVIAGSAIKGMIRQSLGALTSAPMERVAEHHYTYRPNFGHADSPGLVCRPAVVERQDGDEWIVKVLPRARDAEFRVDRKPPDAVRFSYKGGIDGEGLLAESAPRAARVYSRAWISRARLGEATECRISKSVWDAYLRTQRVLSTFHIDSSHPQNFARERVRDAIDGATNIEPGQLIYVEKKVGSNEIVSLGHHYQYRWAYTSSVRCKNGTPRPCLTPHEGEIAVDPAADGPDAPPQQLSGARLLFGYVRNDENQIGKGVFERFAGRIAINHAVSVEKDPERLFVGREAEKYCIPLKILGQPKASAWEFYLQQDESKPVATYGDLPGEAGEDLSGRKFYRHWKSVAETHIRATTEEVLSDQATMARFICKKGTKFRFAIRFARLRDWELGALLAVLQPGTLAGEGGKQEYAHKLGLGRPLGMGSVRIERQDIRVRRESDVEFAGAEATNEVVDRALAAIRQRLVGNKVLDAWLAEHELVDRPGLAYPVDQTRVNDRFEDAIYAWHTKVRQRYSKLRREREGAASWGALHEKIANAR